MEGADIRKLIKRYDRNLRYMCLVEATIDHKISQEDPLTITILKGARGIAYYFWFYGGDWWKPAIAVKWDDRYSGGDGCAYIETYKKRNKIRKPITEIRFVREIDSFLILPEINPLIRHPDEKTIAEYFKRTFQEDINIKLLEKLIKDSYNKSYKKLNKKK